MLFLQINSPCFSLYQFLTRVTHDRVNCSQTLFLRTQKNKQPKWARSTQGWRWGWEGGGGWVLRVSATLPVKSSVLRWRPVLMRLYSLVQRWNKNTRKWRESQRESAGGQARFSQVLSYKIQEWTELSNNFHAQFSAIHRDEFSSNASCNENASRNM